MERVESEREEFGGEEEYIKTYRASARLFMVAEDSMLVVPKDEVLSSTLLQRYSNYISHIKQHDWIKS